MGNTVKQYVSEDGQSVCAVTEGPAPSVTTKKSFINLKKPKANASLPIVPEPDEIKDLVHKIANLKKADAIIRVGELEDKSQKTYFELGGVLSCVQKNGWYVPHLSFDAWVEHTTAMGRAKAWALIAVYDALADCGVPWAKVKHLGWTKMRAVASVLNENASYWIGIASERSKRELYEFVREYKAKPELLEESEPKAQETKIFKLYPEQVKIVKMAIDKVKEDLGAEQENAALEYICMDFMSAQTLEQRLIQLQPDVLATKLTNVFNALDVDTVETVMKEVCKYLVHDLTIEAE